MTEANWLTASSHTGRHVPQLHVFCSVPNPKASPLTTVLFSSACHTIARHAPRSEVLHSIQHMALHGVLAFEQSARRCCDLFMW